MHAVGDHDPMIQARGFRAERSERPEALSLTLDSVPAMRMDTRSWSTLLWRCQQYARTESRRSPVVEVEPICFRPFHLPVLK